MEKAAVKDSIISLEERFRVRNPRSLEHFERGQQVMPGGAKGAYFHKPYPLTMAHGEGCYLYDVDGTRYVDFANHHTAQILGHNHPAVIEAVQEQLKRGIALGAPVGVEAELAEEMCGRVASVERIRFCNSGTEATLHAIRLARGFSGRHKIAKFEGGYHGSHDVVEVSVSPALEEAGPEATPNAVPTAGGISPNATKEVVVLPYNDEAAVEQLITQHRHELACVIFDPKAGILPLRKAFVQFVGELTQQNGVLLIFDEIVGFRVGTGGLQAHYGITPDLTVYGKIVGGGFSRRRIWRANRHHESVGQYPRQHRLLPERHVQCPSHHDAGRLGNVAATDTRRIRPPQRIGRQTVHRAQRPIHSKQHSSVCGQHRLDL